jgi:hypothetical protein
LPLEPEQERMRLQRVVTNAPLLTVPSFALAEVKNRDLREIRLVEQDQITAMLRSLNAFLCTLSECAPCGIWSAKSAV